MDRRDKIAQECILIKSIPFDADENCVGRSVCSNTTIVRICRYYIEQADNSPRFIVQLRNQQAVAELIKENNIFLENPENEKVKVEVGFCPVCVVPNDWVDDPLDDCPEHGDWTFGERPRTELGREKVCHGANKKHDRALDTPLYADGKGNNISNDNGKFVSSGSKQEIKQESFHEDYSETIDRGGDFVEKNSDLVEKKMVSTSDEEKKCVVFENVSDASEDGSQGETQEKYNVDLKVSSNNGTKLLAEQEIKEPVKLPDPEETRHGLPLSNRNSPIQELFDNEPVGDVYIPMFKFPKKPTPGRSPAPIEEKTNNSQDKSALSSLKESERKGIGDGLETIVMKKSVDGISSTSIVRKETVNEKVDKEEKETFLKENKINLKGGVSEKKQVLAREGFDGIHSLGVGLELETILTKDAADDQDLHKGENQETEGIQTWRGAAESSSVPMETIQTSTDLQNKKTIMTPETDILESLKSAPPLVKNLEKDNVQDSQHIISQQSTSNVELSEKVFDPDQRNAAVVSTDKVINTVSQAPNDKSLPSSCLLLGEECYSQIGKLAKSNVQELGGHLDQKGVKSGDQSTQQGDGLSGQPTKQEEIPTYRCQLHKQHLQHGGQLSSGFGGQQSAIPGAQLDQQDLEQGGQLTVGPVCRRDAGLSDQPGHPSQKGVGSGGQPDLQNEIYNDVSPSGQQDVKPGGEPKQKDWELSGLLRQQNNTFDDHYGKRSPGSGGQRGQQAFGHAGQPMYQDFVMPHGQVGFQAFGPYGQQDYHGYPAIPPSGQLLYGVQNPECNYDVPPQPVALYDNKTTGVVTVSTPHMPPSVPETVKDITKETRMVCNIPQDFLLEGHYLATRNIDPEERSLHVSQAAFTNKGKDDIIKGNDLEKFEEENLGEQERWAQLPIKERQDKVVAGGLQDGTNTRKLSGASGVHPLSYPTQISHGASSQLGSVRVEVKQGDITKEVTTAIVNITAESLDLSKGALSKAILRAGGVTIQKECDLKRADMQTLGLVITSGGNLPCRFILHVCACTKAVEWKQAVINCMKEADNKGCTSLTFPALGTGQVGCNPRDVASVMFLAINQYRRPLRSLKIVNIVIFQAEMVDIFKSELKRHLGSTDVRPKTRFPWTRVLVHKVLSDSTANIRGAKSSTDSPCDREFKSLTISKTYCEVIKGLTDYRVEQITKLGTRNGAYIKVNVKKGEIILEGRHEETLLLVLEIQNILHSFEKRKDEIERAMILSSYVQWSYDDDGKWRKFNAEVNFVIETAYKRKDKQVKVQDGSGVALVIDFQSMQEYELIRPINKYKIHRQEVGSQTSIAGINIPKNWIPMGTKDILRQVILSPHDKEYKDIKQKFLVSCGNGTVQQAGIQNWIPGYLAPQTGQRVLQIVRIQNKPLYQQYYAKKQELLIRNKRDPEQWLWHGTSQNSLDKIINKGFDRSYHGKNGAVYGNGVYFAVNASYSIGYCQSTSSIKQIFYSQVLTGETCQGHSGMRFLPERQGSSPGVHVTYDSATNNVSRPSMYIIFHDSQAYPSYLISFI